MADDEVFVTDYYVEYKGCWGSLTLTDQMLHFQADPPRKSTIKLSWLLLDKLQVATANRYRLTIVTKSGKTAAFTVKDRATLDEIRADMKDFVQRAHKLKKSRNATPPSQPYRRQSSLNGTYHTSNTTNNNNATNPITRMFQGALGWYSTTSTRRISSVANNNSANTKNAKHEDPEIRRIKLQYGAEIARDPAITALDHQITQLQRQMVQQQRERQHFQKTIGAQLDQDKRAFKNQQYDLQVQLDRITSIIADDDDVSEDPNYYIARRTYIKAIQKASAQVATKAAPPVLSNGRKGATSTGAQINAKRKTQKQSLEYETDLLQIMHSSMCLQHQISVLQKNKLIVSSFLEREKQMVESELAQDKEFRHQANLLVRSNTSKEQATLQETAIEKLREIMLDNGAILSSSSSSSSSEAEGAFMF